MNILLNRILDRVIDSLDELTANPVWLNKITTYLLSVISPVTTAHAACPCMSCSSGCTQIDSRCLRYNNCPHCGRLYKAYYCAANGGSCTILYPCASCSLPC